MSDVKTKGLLTPEAILSYPHLYTPVAVKPGDPEKYSASFIFTEEQQQTPEYAAMKAAVVAVAQEKWGDKTAALIKSGKLQLPFRDEWEEKGYPENSTFISPRSGHAPGVVAWNLEPISEEAGKKEIYPGAIVRAQVSAFTWEYMGKVGVSFGLDNVQKLRDGERLDGRIAAKNAFTAAEPPAAVDFSDIDQTETQGADVNDELAGLI